ncbi:uncharacterized protein AMSG_08207 [Thecamonas trahens ATCC 50062]|uniref:Uncharacterized protein n=1 Tax=Thecamonas trahens ATCC 50062 TaxID=461836 RepID=A0A0L0DIM8_THETB|nr:hypothetical protein AMSG_08207 [Thecamonas trahens ATCC 50062]KNC51961.1 hypothetical protein AMSG_08207 [Thecamonas trahens ATCC 50062]|eukprot:XP_013755548.1 hypothetical protein AMSG_08207 [Thecamonas trahens ATCC 50062]
MASPRIRDTAAVGRTRARPGSEDAADEGWLADAVVELVAAARARDNDLDALQARFEAVAEAASEAAGHGRLLQRAQEEIARLAHAAWEAERNSVSTDAYQQALAQATDAADACARWKAMYEQAAASRDKAETQVEELRNEAASMRAALAAASEALQESAASVAKLKVGLGRAQAENAALKAELAEAHDVQATARIAAPSLDGASAIGNSQRQLDLDSRAARLAEEQAARRARLAASNQS